MRNCSTPLQTTYFSKLLGVLVGLISALTTLTNSNPALVNVFSWVIVFFIRVTNVSIFPQIVSIFLVMLFLMKPPFLFINIPHLLLQFRPSHLPTHQILAMIQSISTAGLCTVPTRVQASPSHGLSLQHLPQAHTLPTRIPASPAHGSATRPSPQAQLLPTPETRTALAPSTQAHNPPSPTHSLHQLLI
jgi:hypothetical protein